MIAIVFIRLVHFFLLTISRMLKGTNDLKIIIFKYLKKKKLKIYNSNIYLMIIFPIFFLTADYKTSIDKWAKLRSWIKE